MRLQRLRINDVVAGLLVAGAVGIYAAGVAGASPIGMSDVRARAAAIFVIGITACAVGARPDAFREDAPTGRFVSVLTALGLGATVVGLVAIVLASTDYLTVLIIGIATLWLGASWRHLVAPPPPTQYREVPRELVKR